MLLDPLHRDVQGRGHPDPIVVQLPELHRPLLRPRQEALHIPAYCGAGTRVVPRPDRLGLQVMGGLHGADRLALLPLPVLEQPAESALPVLLHPGDRGAAQRILDDVGHHFDELHASAAGQDGAHSLVQVHDGLCTEVIALLVVHQIHRLLHHQHAVLPGSGPAGPPHLEGGIEGLTSHARPPPHQEYLVRGVALVEHLLPRLQEATENPPGQLLHAVPGDPLH
mmetsp:Transcript_37779/g.98942  ORF Transcript_37779/g.98942 Transcript_37779/m.98942 type:complete len:224 (-) Transcript_37779:754-1425(-)